MQTPFGAAGQSYLVRIYRRDKCDPSLVAGLVEIIEDNRTVQFRDMFQLMEIMGIRLPSGGRPAANRS